MPLAISKKSGFRGGFGGGFQREMHKAVCSDSEKNVKSHSNQAETDLFIAGIVLGRGKDFS